MIMSYDGTNHFYFGCKTYKHPVTKPFQPCIKYIYWDLIISVNLSSILQPISTILTSIIYNPCWQRLLGWK